MQFKQTYKPNTNVKQWIRISMNVLEAYELFCDLRDVEWEDLSPKERQLYKGLKKYIDHQRNIPKGFQ